MCVGIFYDILVYSQSYESHVQHLESVFQLLQSEQWSVKKSKYSQQFALEEHLICVDN
jgi:hypothetical protein